MKGNSDYCGQWTGKGCTENQWKQEYAEEVERNKKCLWVQDKAGSGINNSNSEETAESEDSGTGDINWKWRQLKEGRKSNRNCKWAKTEQKLVNG